MKKNYSAISILTDPVHCLAFGFGTGLSPVAPGTFGTLVGVLFFWKLLALPVSFYLLVVMLLFTAGTYLCGESARRLGVHDHGGIVWDEIVGYLVTMIPIACAMPQAAALPQWAWAAAGFVLFRIFDIAKPPPVGWADQKVHGGFGIMLDDLIAGAYAAFILALLILLAPHLVAAPA